MRRASRKWAHPILATGAQEEIINFFFKPTITGVPVFSVHATWDRVNPRPNGPTAENEPEVPHIIAVVAPKVTI
jgi:hypothetical protein